MLLSTILGLMSLASLAMAKNTTNPRTIIEFPNPTWLENLAATRNGTILTGTLGGTAAELHIVNPFSSSNNSNTLLYTFPGFNSVFGITEYKVDIFAVITGNYSSTTGPVEGTYSVWSVDLSTRGVVAKKIACLPHAKLLNGATTLNSRTVLLAESFGSILALDVETGVSSPALSDATLEGNTSLALGIGVNGVKYVNNHVYYTNLQLGLVGRVPVDPSTGVATGAFTILTRNVSTSDDLVVTDDGTVFVARPFDKKVDRVSPDGTVVTVVDGHLAGQQAVSGTTSLVWGRTAKDRGVLYLATYGGNVGENGDGDRLGGGKIVAVDMC